MVNQHEHHKRVRQFSDVITKNDFVEEMKLLGLRKGMIVYVVSDLHGYAYINGGNQSIIEGLQEVVGYEGSIIMPAYSPNLVDPACQSNVRFERDLYEQIRSTSPTFHKKRTPANSPLANQMMRNDGVYRSNHPMYSCIAWGKYAKLLCDKHPLHFALGKDSFLDKVSLMNGYVLLLGGSYQKCDIFQHAATLAMHGTIKIVSAPIEKKGQCEFVDILDMEYENLHTNEIAHMMEERSVVKDTYLQNAHVRFFKAKEARDLAIAYYKMK